MARRRDVVAAVAKALGESQRAVDRVVQATLDAVQQLLVADKRLELRGFGVFTVRRLKRQKTRNPRTGRVLYIKATATIDFRPGNGLKAAVKPKARGRAAKKGVPRVH